MVQGQILLTQNGEVMELGLQHVHTACASMEKPRTRSTYACQLRERINERS
jgi:hypothetical protein